MRFEYFYMVVAYYTLSLTMDYFEMDGIVIHLLPKIIYNCEM